MMMMIQMMVKPPNQKHNRPHRHPLRLHHYQQVDFRQGGLKSSGDGMALNG
jgi:hypothetical protein